MLEVRFGKREKTWMHTYVSDGLLSVLNLHQRLSFRTIDNLERPERSQCKSQRSYGLYWKTYQ